MNYILNYALSFSIIVLNLLFFTIDLVNFVLNLLYIDSDLKIYINNIYNYFLI